MITQENIPYTADEIKAMLKTCEKYNKAREKARELMDKGYDVLMPEIFPELQEDKDERIRKTIYGWIYTQPSEFFDNGFSKEEMLAWLEKQGEKKPTDEVEPKFKIGNWITDGRLTCKVLGVTGKSYELHLHNDDYCHFETDIQSVNKYYHLWTIHDAMDGDVLVGKDYRPFIFTGEFDVQDDNPTAYCGINSDDKFITGKGSHWTFKDGIKPATKEQRDWLFSKMKEAGYEWDSEKKELKKIEVASKESGDERMLREIKRYIKEQGDKPTGLPNGTVPVSDMITWLEKQGDNIPTLTDKDYDNLFVNCKHEKG